MRTKDISTEELAKLVEIKMKQLQSKEISHKIRDWEQRRIAIEEGKLCLDKISKIKECLQSITYDGEKTMPGCEPQFKQTFEGKERDRLIMNFHKILSRM